MTGKMATATKEITDQLFHIAGWGIYLNGNPDPRTRERVCDAVSLVDILDTKVITESW